ncbi:hypothetical protein [Cryptosporangium phraense]|uniref:hypothetical protein n=1 Tax=Cryptosporangium phraense TaxID=2593070 RepID=UPI001F0DCEE9|nr:hypothetical protein [Cryptosporangium phraense]
MVPVPNDVSDPCGGGLELTGADHRRRVVELDLDFIAPAAELGEFFGECLDPGSKKIVVEAPGLVVGEVAVDDEFFLGEPSLDRCEFGFAAGHCGAVVFLGGAERVVDQVGSGAVEGAQRLEHYLVEGVGLDPWGAAPLRPVPVAGKAGVVAVLAVLAGGRRS